MEDESKSKKEGEDEGEDEEDEDESSESESWESEMNIWEEEREEMLAALTRKKEEAKAYLEKMINYSKEVREKFKPKVSKKKKLELVKAF